jgi:signal recognition particle subunit SRP54
VKDLIAKIRVRALEDEVLKSLTPGQQVVKITNEELTLILGGEDSRKLTKGDVNPSVLLIAGLNGAGKTTTAAKLASYLKQGGELPVLVAADLQRPAAINQLKTLGENIGVDVYISEESQSSQKVAKEGIEYASKSNASWVIIDTAGRFQVDDNLMSELEDIKSEVSPSEILLVADAMTGQDAINTAEGFHSQIGLTGLVLTKLDGDARGGAALSISSVTGIPIKFVGTGEKVDDLEEFHPDRLASRILGMGDMLTLIEKTQASFDKSEAKSLEKKIRQNTLDLEDFLEQIQKLKNMGPLGQILDMLPGMTKIKPDIDADAIGDEQVKKVESIIYSMTPYERHKPDIIDGSRRRRIALGSGTTAQDVNKLLNQFRQMQKLMKQMSSGKGLGDLTRMIRR